MKIVSIDRSLQTQTPMCYNSEVELGGAWASVC